MKKFLPFILFILVFSGILVWQIGFSKLSPNTSALDTFDNHTERSDYSEYEKLFLESKFQTLEKTALIPSKLTAPIVIINFWASWCIPCLEEMPSMMNLKTSLPSDLIQIIAVNTDEDEQLKNIAKTKKKLKISNEFIIVPDRERLITGNFGVSAIPVSIVFLHGKVVHVSNGPMDFFSAEFREKIKIWTKV